MFRLLIATTLPSAGVIVAALAGSALLIGALALLMRRRPDAFPLLVVFALPFRLPISTDGRTVNLLIPLYLVVAAGTLTHLMPRLLMPRLLGRGVAPDESGTNRPSGRPTNKGGGPDKGISPGKLSTLLSPRGLEWLLIGAVALYALQGIYSTDHAKAA